MRAVDSRRAEGRGSFNVGRFVTAWAGFEEFPWFVGFLIVGCDGLAKQVVIGDILVRLEVTLGVQLRCLFRLGWRGLYLIGIEVVYWLY